jgi:hypothetical protein
MFRNRRFRNPKSGASANSATLASFSVDHARLMPTGVNKDGRTETDEQKLSHFLKSCCTRRCIFTVVKFGVRDNAETERIFCDWPEANLVASKFSGLFLGGTAAEN